MSAAFVTKLSKGKAAKQAQKPLDEVSRQSAPTSPYGAVLALQRNVGNHAVNHFLGSGFSSSPSAGSAVLQRKCACGATDGGECASCQEKKALQRASAFFQKDSHTEEDAPSIVSEVLHSPGHTLDPVARDYFESQFDHDFSQVRVHTGTKAAESARAVNALAFTVGRDVVFGADQYAPRTAGGRRLLAHELTHVMQQSAATVDSGRPLRLANPSSNLEREADAAAEDSSLPAVSTQSSFSTVSRAILQRVCITDPECKPATPSAQPGTAVKGSAEHFGKSVEHEERELAQKEKRKTKQEIRKEFCSKVPPDPRCTSDGHSRRATAFEELFRSYVSAQSKFVTGVFIDKDISSAVGAYFWGCGFFTPKIPGDRCIFIPEHLENEAVQYKKGEKTIKGRDRVDWLNDTFSTITHELEHARFREKFPKTEPKLGACSFGDVSHELSELAAIMSEFPVLYQASVSKSWSERRATFANWFNYKLTQPQKHGETIAGILKAIRCRCECSDVDAYIKKVTEFTTANWTDAEKNTFHTELRDPKWKLEWPIVTPLPPRDLPALTLTPSGQLGYGYRGSSGMSVGLGLDFGIPLDRLGKWQLLLGAHGHLIAGLGDDLQSAYLLGLKIGFLRGPALGSSGVQVGAFGEIGGGRFEQGLKGEGGAYAVGGVSLRYSAGLAGRSSPFLGIEAAGGARIDATKPEVQKLFFAGLSAGLQF